MLLRPSSSHPSHPGLANLQHLSTHTFLPCCLQFLEDVRELEGATTWTRAVDNKYRSLFGVRG